MDPFNTYYYAIAHRKTEIFCLICGHNIGVKWDDRLDEYYHELQLYYAVDDRAHLLNCPLYNIMDMRSTSEIARKKLILVNNLKHECQGGAGYWAMQRYTHINALLAIILIN